jgi:hypothetical protein
MRRANGRRLGDVSRRAGQTVVDATANGLDIFNHPIFNAKTQTKVAKQLTAMAWENPLRPLAETSTPLVSRSETAEPKTALFEPPY